MEFKAILILIKQNAELFNLKVTIVALIIFVKNISCSSQKSTLHEVRLYLKKFIALVIASTGIHGVELQTMLFNLKI